MNIFSWRPPQASSYAEEVDALFLTLMAFSGFLVVVLFGLLLVFAVRYRQGSSASRQPAGTPKTARRVEIAWLAAPLLPFLILFVWAGLLYADIYSPPRDGLNVYVVGKQWMWKVQHENGRREINRLHVPVHQDILITLGSQDVIHSFYIPAFRVKHDAVPGRYSRMWFRPTREGTYPLFCAEYCGALHSRMTGEVVVMSASDYQDWLAAGQPAVGMAAAGERLFHQVGCSGCHAPSAIVHAPLLEGLYGKPVALQDGTLITADRQYLQDSILLPNKHVAAGFDPVMPTYQDRLTPEQINELVAYLISLQGSPPPLPPAP